MTTPTRATAGARISSAYAARDPREHVAQRLARAWEHDAEAERLLALPPDKREALPQATRLSLGYYAGAREAAKALGLDTSAPAVTS